MPPTKRRRRPNPNPPPPWRSFADLSPSEKTAVRRMYSRGVTNSAIAQRCRVYVGTIISAAKQGNWSQPENVESIRKRIAAAVAKNPNATNAEIAALVGTKPNYVEWTRVMLRRAARTRPAKRPAK